MLHRQEHHTDAVTPRLRQNESQLYALPRQELMRDLNENACAVARFRIAPAGATVRQIDEDLDPFLHDLVRFLAIKIHHEAHAAGVVLLTGMIQSLWSGRVTHGSEYLRSYYHVNSIYRLAILA